MPGEIVVGLDIGTTKVCSVVAETGPAGALQITGTGVSPCSGLRKGVVADLSETARSVRESIAKAAKQAQVEIHSVTIGVTGEHIASMNAKGTVAVARREVMPEDQASALQQTQMIPCPPDRQILHAIPRSYSVDGQDGIQNPVGMTGERLEAEAHVVTAGKSFVDNLAKAVQRAGLSIDPDGIVLASLASAEAVLSEEEKQVGVVLLDIGGGATDLAAFRKGKVCYTAVIPVGGWHVTHDLALGLNIAEEEAERIKREYGTALVDAVKEDEIIEVRRPGVAEPMPLPRRLLAEIIGPRMEELFELAAEKVREAGIGTPGAGTVLTGGASLLSGTLETADRVLGETEVRLGLPRCAGGIADSVAKPPFAAAVGLAMIAAGRSAEAEADSEGEDHLLRPVHRGLRRFVRGMFRGPKR